MAKEELIREVNTTITHALGRGRDLSGIGIRPSVIDHQAAKGEIVFAAKLEGAAEAIRAIAKDQSVSDAAAAQKTS